MCSWQSIKEPTSWLFLHLQQIELVRPSAPNAWSNLNCVPDFTMLSVDAWVLLQITQHAVEIFGTAVNVLNSRIGLIYFITTDVEFHAFFVKNMWRLQNLCGWSFLNLKWMKRGIKLTWRAHFIFCLPLHMKFKALLVNLPIQGLS